MAKEYIFLQGKSKWAKLDRPDPKYNYWGLELYLTEESLNKFNELKTKKNGIDGLKTTLKKDDDGYFVSLRRYPTKEMRGKLVTFAPPEVLDGSRLDTDGQPLPLKDKMIGNGSDVTVRLERYTHNIPGSDRRGSAIRVESVRVDNLVPYDTGRDFTPEQKELIEGLAEQPEQKPNW